MPTTPQSWRPQQVVSTSDGFADNENDQYDPRIIHLASGNILVTYSTNSDEGDADPSGRDIMGRLYDPLGTALGAEWRVNDVAHNNEYDMEIAALPNGGFISVYTDLSDWSIYMRVYDSTGSGDPSITVIDGAATAGLHRNPNIAAASNNLAFITYEVLNGLGDVDIVGRYFNPSSGAVFAENTIFNGGSGVGEGLEGHSVTALNNDTFVVAWADQDGSATDNDDLQFSIVNIFTGASSPTTVYNSNAHSSDPHVTALTGGGFVVTWVTGAPTSGVQGVRARIYDSAGSNPSAVFNPATTNQGSQLAPVAASLQDGGFVIVWYDAPRQDINGQRYDSSGTKVGTEFTLDTQAFGNPFNVDIDIEGLADGRFAITWSETRSGGWVPGGGTGSDSDVRMAIWDPRDDPNAPVYTPENWQVGTIGNDNITGATANVVHGWNGNDFIEGGGLQSNLFGDHGDDRIWVEGLSDFESANGGSGVDTLLLGEAFDDGTVVDLLNGTLTSPNMFPRSVIGFENIQGSSADEAIYGTDGVNRLTSGFGSDTVFGRGGNDLFIAAPSMAGDLDDLYGDAGSDTINFFSFVSAVWVDLDYSGSTGIEAWTRDNEGVTSGAWRGLAHLTEIENIYGTGYADEIYGDDNANVITPSVGNDIVSTYGGDDTIHIYSGFDYIDINTGMTVGGDYFDDVDGGSGVDLANFSDMTYAVWVDLDYTGSTGIEAWHRFGSDVDSGPWTPLANLENIENIVGSYEDDELRGDGDANVLSGYWGDDRIIARAGNDTIHYRGGFDDIDGGAGIDTTDFSQYDNAVWVDLSYSGSTGNEAWTTGGSSIDPVAGEWEALANLTGIENLVGTNHNDIFYDDLGNNALSGGYGNDHFRLSGGFDTVDGGLHTDLAGFSDYQTAVWVDLAYTGSTGYEAWTRGGADVESGAWQAIADLTGIENLEGSNYDDRLVGNASQNVLTGQGGDDQLVFSEGWDEYRGQTGSDTADFSTAGFAIYVALDYSFTDREAWTRDGTDLDSGTWRPIGDLSSVENIVGSDFEDYLRGDTADNRLTGRGGGDSFAFHGNFGSDTITDFDDVFGGPQDLIDFSQNASVESFADITDISQVSGDTVITTVDGIVTLENFTGGIGLADIIF